MIIYCVASLVYSHRVCARTGIHCEYISIEHCYCVIIVFAYSLSRRTNMEAAMASCVEIANDIASSAMVAEQQVQQECVYTDITTAPLSAPADVVAEDAETAEPDAKRAKTGETGVTTDPSDCGTTGMYIYSVCFYNMVRGDRCCCCWWCSEQG